LLADLSLVERAVSAPGLKTNRGARTRRVAGRRQMRVCGAPAALRVRC